MNIEETLKKVIRGEWRDVIKNAATGKILLDTGWKPNQIQDTNATLLAMLFRELIQGSPAITAGPQYLAIGSGQTSWDTAPPTLSRSDTTLDTEFERKQLTASDIVYIDPTTKAVSGSETRAIEITVTFSTSEGNGGIWREFGFFGGDATGATDSGYMINWVSHGRIDKDSTMTIVRKCRFIFQLET